jgi:superfamily II DNA/RNA helicase
MGIASPFPIQEMTIPEAIARRDVLGRAQTGSGKTLAFGLAMLSNLAFRKARPYRPLSLVMVPTRELAMQVTDALMPFAQAVDLDIRLVAGGMPYAKQIDALRKAVPILVATPGRLNDLVEQGHVVLEDIEITVIDEADQMCDMGFAPQIIAALDLIGPDAQHLLFSATLDGDVDKIVRTYLHDPVRHSIEVDESRMEAMEHFLLAVHPGDKQQVVAEIASRAGLTIMFARTQLGVERIANELMALGVACGALHGGKTQGARTKTLNQFKDGTTNVLVATDVAARGIHVDGVSLVVHIDPPKDPKDYVHRAGRTARAGAEGTVVTIVAPRQQRTVLDMMNKAGVNPEVLRIRPMDEELVAVTGAREPSGVPWHPPAEKRKSSGRPPGRSGGRSSGRPSGAGSGRPRNQKPRG